MDRKEVEAYLETCAKFPDDGRRLVSQAHLVGLCRTWLAVQDAPVGTVSNWSPEGMPGAWVVAKDDPAGIYPKLAGQRVRLVLESDAVGIGKRGLT